MSISLTEKAIKTLKDYQLTNESFKDSDVRIGVSAGGCSGYNYFIEFSQDFDTEKDYSFVEDGINIIVDRKSILMLEGTEIDYFESLEKSGFVFNNPNATKQCGCGTSFEV